MNLSRTLLLALVFVAVAQVAMRYDEMPEHLASHFDAEGIPNGFLSRPAFFGLHLGLVGTFAFVFLLLPQILPKLPTSLINLPRKDYWLAPERRNATFDHMGRMLAWFGCASTSFLIYIEELVIHANLPGAEGRIAPTWLWAGLGAYFAFLVIWLVPLLIHYFRVPKASSQ